MEDIAEQQEVANEIAEAISNPVGLQADDDDDLLAELEKLEEVRLSRTFLFTCWLQIDCARLGRS